MSAFKKGGAFGKGRVLNPFTPVSSLKRAVNRIHWKV
jgi:hypothetical protein